MRLFLIGRPKLFLLASFSLVLCSCTRLHSLGLKRHDFNQERRQIIWLQVPGLELEHLAFLKFSHPQEYATEFEKMTCLGGVWAYSFSALRPPPHLAALSQLTGSSSLTGKCEDYQNKPIWGFLGGLYYQNLALEYGVSPEQSLASAWSKKCLELPGEEDPLAKFRKKLGLLLMRKAPPLPAQNKEENTKESTKGSTTEEHNFFHFQSGENPNNLSPFISSAGIFYDQSCQSGTCFATREDNVKYILSELKKDEKNFFFLIRDFSYYRAISEGKLAEAREELFRIHDLVKVVRAFQENHEDTMLIVSSASAFKVQFPGNVAEWEKFEKLGKGIEHRRASLTYPVFASGAGAENFCGVFREKEFLERIFWSPKRGEFNLSISEIL